jgi:hypothetical protein
MSQEAKATSRKAPGRHNRVDRAGQPEIPTPKGGRQGTGAPSIGTTKARERRCKIETLLECNLSRRGVTLSLPVGRDERWTWEPCAVKVARTVLRRGECREAPTYSA